MLGGAPAAVWRNITARREREIKRNDQIRAKLVLLVALYNGVKSVRRILRSLGRDLKTYPNAERETVRQTAMLTKEQADGFHAQMLILDGLQLEFESKAKQFGQTNFLEDDTDQVVKNLGRVENHLNQVSELREQSGWTIREGTPLQLVSDGLVRLFRVTNHLRPEVSNPLRETTRLINKHVFGEATEPTQKALAAIVSEHNKRDPDKATASGAAT